MLFFHWLFPHHPTRMMFSVSHLLLSLLCPCSWCWGASLPTWAMSLLLTLHFVLSDFSRNKLPKCLGMGTVPQWELCEGDGAAASQHSPPSSGMELPQVRFKWAQPSCDLMKGCETIDLGSITAGGDRHSWFHDLGVQIWPNLKGT